MHCKPTMSDVARLAGVGTMTPPTSLLFDRITRGETPHLGNRIALPVEIVLRNSCGCKQSDAVVIRSGN